MRRMLLVHAHPDDETINNGATMAEYAADGAALTLVTCTRGEQGEVIPPNLAHLEASAAGSGDPLGDHRVGELAAAMAVLGVSDHRFLGDPAIPGRTAAKALADGGTVYRDSGMAYDDAGAVVPAPEPPVGAFALADVEQAAQWLATVIREVRPQVVIGYDPHGGYGHPDHVQAHLVMMRAVELAGSSAATALVAFRGTQSALPEPALPVWNVAKVYWTVSSDDAATTVIDATRHTEAKRAAMLAHETQLAVTPDGALFGLSNGVQQPITGLEYYRLVQGSLGGERDQLGRETDLFGGLEL